MPTLKESDERNGGVSAEEYNPAGIYVAMLVGLATIGLLGFWGEGMDGTRVCTAGDCAKTASAPQTAAQGCVRYYFGFGHGPTGVVTQCPDRTVRR
ncbi:MAG: hypothetical protein WCV84_05775 [Patescibacteria group bacterium]